MSRVIDVTGLPEHEIKAIEAHVRGLRDGPETYPTPRRGWTCFHCGETFRTDAGARLHFGEKPLPGSRPVCC